MTSLTCGLMKWNLIALHYIIILLEAENPRFIFNRVTSTYKNQQGL